MVTTSMSELDCAHLLNISCTECVNSLCNATTTKMNTTMYPPLPYGPALTAFLAFIAAITSVATATGNILVLLAFVLERNLRQPSNYLIASLAVTDILIGVFSMPFYTLYLLKAWWPLGRTLCYLWLSLDYTVCLVSQYTVFLITLDRFCSVKAPAKYRNWRTTQKIKFMIVLIWFIPAAIFFTTIMGWNTFRGVKPSEHDYTCAAQFEESPLFTAILVISYYWVTLVIMVALYIGIYRVALTLHNKARSKRNRLKQMGHLTTNNNDMQPLTNGREISLSTPSTRNGIQRDYTNTENCRNANTKHIDIDSETSNENSSDSAYSNKNPSSRNHTQNSAQTPSIIIDYTPTNVTPVMDSPLWKPRPSLPNSRIYWDAFSQGTTSSQQVTEITECNDSSANDPDKDQEAKLQSSSARNEQKSQMKEEGSVGKLLRKLRFRDREKGSPQAKSKSENRARKALRTISFILGAFVICWTPYHVTVLIAAFCKSNSESCVSTRFYEFTYWLCYMNSPLNPFCYALSNNQFKKAFLRIIKGEYIRRSRCGKCLR